ncbi:MAG: ATP-binding cassette domain-containing protein [Acidobacteriia bacterium]|nr:ATP-binding cassette domain-containing protein [Terriglobia bacterium]
MGHEPLVVIDKVNHYFGEGELRRQILFDVTVEIDRGEIVILTGPSGGGKTTLLTLIGGLRSVQEGSLKVLGHELRGASEADRVKVRKKIGYIFQAHNLIELVPAEVASRHLFRAQEDVGKRVLQFASGQGDEFPQRCQLGLQDDSSLQALQVVVAVARLLQQLHQPAVEQVLPEENHECQGSDSAHGHGKASLPQVGRPLAHEQRPIPHRREREQCQLCHGRNQGATTGNDRGNRLRFIETAASGQCDPEEEQQGDEKRKVVEPSRHVRAAGDGRVHGFRGEGVNHAGDKDVAIEFSPGTGTRDERPARHPDQHQPFDQVQKIPARGVHAHIGHNVLVRENRESIDDNPPHQKNKDIQSAGEHAVTAVDLVWANGDGSHNRHDMQEQDNVSDKRVGQGLPSNDFKPGPSRLVKSPHHHTHGHQAPEQACVPAAIEGISEGEDGGGNGHQERDQIAHRRAEEGTWKDMGSKGKAQQEAQSAEEKRDFSRRHHRTL